MGKTHLFLKNPVGNANHINTGRFVPPSEKEEEDDEEVKDYTFQKERLSKKLIKFKGERVERRIKKTIELPFSLEYIRIDFFRNFADPNNDFLKNYGLNPIKYSRFNKSVLFYIKDENKFSSFMRKIEDFINDPDVNNIKDENKIVSLIYSFLFLSSREIKRGVDVSSSLLLNFTERNEQYIEQWNRIHELFQDYLFKNNIKVKNITANTIEIWKEQDTYIEIDELVDNFDIIQSVQASPTINVQPSSFSTPKFDWGFSIKVGKNTPIIGVIDSGIDMRTPLGNIVYKESSLLKRSMGVGSSHGTNVGGLVVLGSRLNGNIIGTIDADARIFSIQAMYKETGEIPLSELKNTIIDAHINHSVRIFNLSICGRSFLYNSDISEYARMLDELAFDYDLLILIAAGNLEKEYHAFCKDCYGERTSLVNYPFQFYNDIDIDMSQPSNIGSPAESMNNITIGAIAYNGRDEDVDLTNASDLPAYYTRKYHVDYSQKINNSPFTIFQINKNIFKPDILMPGGDWHKSSSSMEVIGRGSGFNDFFEYMSGTSLATPLLANLIARIITKYPQLNTQSIKALVINSSEVTKINQLTENIIASCKDKEAQTTFGRSFISLTRKEKMKISKMYDNDWLGKCIHGHGIVNEDICLNSTDKRVTFVIEDEIKSKCYKVQHIKIPDYLLGGDKKNVIKIVASLCYKFAPTPNRHLEYNPIHISFNYINARESCDRSAYFISNKNKPIETKDVNSQLAIKAKLSSWSEDFSVSYNQKIFSNTQKKDAFYITREELAKINNEIGVVVRCIVKSSYWDEEIQNPYSLVIRIEEVDNIGLEDRSLYDELKQINIVENIATVEQTLDIDIN